MTDIKTCPCKTCGPSCGCDGNRPAPKAGECCCGAECTCGPTCACPPACGCAARRKE